MRLRFFKRRTSPTGIPSTTTGTMTSAPSAAAKKTGDPKASSGKPSNNSCWEVVDCIDIAPIITASYLSDEFLARDALMGIARQDISRTYVFYVRPKDNQHQKELTQQAVIFARRQLLAEARRHGFNSFIREGWKLTLFRDNNRWRIEVRYTARPASMSRKFQSHTPPFLEMLGA